MSASAQIRDLVENAVSALTGEYEERIKALEARVSALESPAPKSAPATRKTAAVKAHAGTAEAKGTAGTAETRTQGR